MVDINLFGEDSPQEEERDENNENFSETYSSDAKELTSEPPLQDSVIDDDLYDKSYTRSGSRKGVFIALAFVFAAIIVVVGIFVINSGKDKSKIVEVPIDETVVEPTKESAQDQTDLQMNIKPTIDIPASVKAMISSSQQGVKTVEKIITTIPQNMSFTLIQYRDGNFLTELLGDNSANFSRLKDQLQQSMTNGEVKILSQSNKNIKDHNYKQTLLNGSINAPMLDTIEPPKYKDLGSIKSEFSQFCNKYGLKIKQFEISKEIKINDQTKTPVLFRAVGNKDAALNFLNTVIDENYNVNLSKIVLIASNTSLRTTDVNLVLNLEVYNPI